MLNNVATPVIQSSNNGDKNNTATPTPFTICTQEIAESTPSVNKTFPTVDRCTAGGTIDFLTPVRTVRRTQSLSLKEELELAESLLLSPNGDEENHLSDHQTPQESVIMADTTRGEEIHLENSSDTDETQTDGNVKFDNKEDASAFFQKNSYVSSEEDVELLLGCSINSILLRNVYDLYEVSSYKKNTIVADIIRELVMDPDCPGQKFVGRECEKVS